MEAIGREARNVVVQAEMKRRSFRGVIDVIYGGERPEKVTETAGKNGKTKPGKTNKRKADVLDDVAEDDITIEVKPISNREQKRQAKKARLQQSQGQNNSTYVPSKASPTPEGNPKPSSVAPLQNTAESNGHG